MVGINQRLELDPLSTKEHNSCEIFFQSQHQKVKQVYREQQEEETSQLLPLVCSALVRNMEHFHPHTTQ